MKKATRYILGLLASLFLTLGLTRAAEAVDPDPHQLVTTASAADERSCLPSIECTSPTFW